MASAYANVAFESAAPTALTVPPPDLPQCSAAARDTSTAAQTAAGGAAGDLYTEEEEQESLLVVEDSAPLCDAGPLDDSGPSDPDQPAAAGGPAPAPDAVAQWDRSPGGMLVLQQQLLAMEFPLLEDTPGQDPGAATWDNAFEMVKGLVGQGYVLVKRNKSMLHRNKAAAAASLKQNRVSFAMIICEQGGKPGNKRNASSSSRRTTTKKIGCGFNLNMLWPFNALTPRVSETSLCLTHVPASSGQSRIEHRRPQVFDNELREEDILGQMELIQHLHNSGVKTSEIHKGLQTPGKRLGARGKAMVRSLRRKVEYNKAIASGLFNDAQVFLKEIQSQGCWMRFKLDEEKRITCIA